MTTNNRKHIHKYHRVTLSIGRVWACALPECQHHMPQVYEGLVPGKASYCWKCGDQFILNEQNMKNDKPLCDDCSGMNDLAALISQRV